MTNTELINAYLDNELSDADRLNFEQRLDGDAVLQQELALQKDIVEGIRLARKTQLKQMLNNVPVAQTTVWSAGKIAAVVAIVAATIAGIFYFMPDNNSDVPSTTTELNEPIAEKTPEVTVGTETEETDNLQSDEEVPAQEENEPVAETTEDSVEENVESQPEDKRPVVAPNFEREDTERSDVTAPDGSILGDKVSTPTDTDVEINASSENYTFHYAFEPGMLKLYGDFEKELYEILEFNTAEGSVWFLEYQSKYYFLDNSSDEIRPLSEVTDAKLLEVLSNIE